MTSFETANSVFNKTDENNSFAITIPGYWNSEDGEEPVYKLTKLLELTFENDIELHVKAVRKKDDQREIEKNEYLRLSDLDTRKDSIIKELKK